MKIVYKQGDLFQCSEPGILHGCNAQGVMGSGVAKTVKELYPSAFQAYKRAHDLGECKLGTVTVGVSELGDKFILNCITQEYYGRNKDIVYVSYNAVEDAMHRVDKWCRQNYINTVAMPKIGAGLANGDWEIIAEIIQENSSNFIPVVYTL